MFVKTVLSVKNVCLAGFEQCWRSEEQQMYFSWCNTSQKTMNWWYSKVRNSVGTLYMNETYHSHRTKSAHCLCGGDWSDNFQWLKNGVLAIHWTFRWTLDKTNAYLDASQTLLVERVLLELPEITSRFCVKAYGKWLFWYFSEWFICTMAWIKKH